MEMEMRNRNKHAGTLDLFLDDLDFTISYSAFDRPSRVDEPGGVEIDFNIYDLGSSVRNIDVENRVYGDEALYERVVNNILNIVNYQ